MDAIRVERVTKRFRRYRPIAPHTSLKSAFVDWARRRVGRSKHVDDPNRYDVMRDVTFSVPRGETLGIIGGNGAGKTTLLKLIAGIYRPNEGRVVVSGRVAALLELGAGFHPDFSGRENVMLSGIVYGLSRRQVRACFDDVVAFSELGERIDAPVRTYSSGMFTRLAFSVAIHVDPDVLLLDEILAVGDESFQRKSRAALERRMRSGDRTTVIVSHDLEEIGSLCHRVAVIDPPQVVLYDQPAEAIAVYRKRSAPAPV
ncbi:MAG TPA: ABC transporter ATP-binding protein [Candidatus Polarisedimenticolaceae bacterium]|nr:ABC transporter ATP-binding protein [Candidatus Polarisedimenticolaceae bacterium]